MTSQLACPKSNSSRNSTASRRFPVRLFGLQGLATRATYEGSSQRDRERSSDCHDRVFDMPLGSDRRQREAAFLLPHGRGDEFQHGGSVRDPRERLSKGPPPRDGYVPERHVDSIKVKARDFH
jgi:hypothetical protein